MFDLTLLAAAAEAAAEHGEEPTAWLLGPGGWVAAAMLAVFALMLYMKVPAIVAGMLDKQIADISSQLNEAARLRAEAEALKAEYEKKLGDAAKDADALKSAAEAEAKLIVAKAKSDAESLIARRSRMAEDKIAAEERAAVKQLRAAAVDGAARAAARLIAERDDAGTDEKLVNRIIAELPQAN